MSESPSDCLTRKEKFMFALFVSIFGGPLGLLLFPFVYAKPIWFAERLFPLPEEDESQTTLDKYTDGVSE